MNKRNWLRFSGSGDPTDLPCWSRAKKTIIPSSFEGDGLVGRGPFDDVRIWSGRYTIYDISNLIEIEWADPDVRRMLEPYGVTVELKAGESTEVELVFAPSNLRPP